MNDYFAIGTVLTLLLISASALALSFGGESRTTARLMLASPLCILIWPAILGVAPGVVLWGLWKMAGFTNPRKEDS